MSIEEDRAELQGSDYERKLYDIKNGYVDKFLVEVSPSVWEFHNTRPPPGKGVYIERMPDGQCRRWNNHNEHDNTYTLA